MSTQITCLTRAFQTNTRINAPTQTLTININGQTDSSQTITVSNSPGAITALTPSIASPVLKVNLTLTVSGYYGILSTSDLSV
jgi:hypothetical protein